MHHSGRNSENNRSTIHRIHNGHNCIPASSQLSTVGLEPLVTAGLSPLLQHMACSCAAAWGFLQTLLHPHLPVGSPGRIMCSHHPRMQKNLGCRGQAAIPGCNGSNASCPSALQQDILSHTYHTQTPNPGSGPGSACSSSSALCQCTDCCTSHPKAQDKIQTQQESADCLTVPSTVWVPQIPPG